MRKLIAAGAMLALAACSAPVPPASPSDVIPSVVKITVTEDGGHAEGSAVVIATGKGVSYLLTCAHVTDGQGTVEVTKDGKTVQGYVMAADKALDLSLVQVNETLPAVSMAPQAPHTGDVELVVGYPLDGGLQITQGFVGEPDAKDHSVEGSAAVMPGNSGGPVFVNQGGWKLVGLAQSVRGIPMGPFNIMPVATNSYWIPMERIQTFLKAHPIA